MAFKNPTVQKIWLSLNNSTFLPLMTFLDGLVTSGAGWPVVRALTAAALQANTYSSTTQTKTANANGAMATVDGVTLAVGDRFWDKDAATGSQRGLFKVVSIGGASAKWSAVRDDSASASAQFVDGKSLEVGGEGTANGGEVFFLTNATFVLDTDTPALARETGVVHVDDAQSITGIKKFVQLALATWNAAKTFAASFTFNGTAARTVTIPDVDLTIAQAGVASAGTAPAFTGGAPVFTGTAPAGAVDLAAPVFSGTGQASAGQVITTTDNQTMTLNQCAGMWFVSATHGPYLIASNTAVTGAQAVLTIYGGAPTTDAGTYKIVRGPTPAGTVAAVTGTVASHTHVQT